MIFIALLLVVVALSAVQLIRLRRATRELTHDVEVLVARPASRPALEPVISGSFELRAKPIVDALKKSRPKAWSPPWREAPGSQDMLAGKRTPDSIPGVEEDVDFMMPWVEELVWATHAERPSQPADRVPLEADLDRNFLVHHAVRILAIQQWRLLRAGEAGRALRYCVDSLSLARDIGAGGTLMDAMFSCTMVGTVRDACAASADAAAPDDKRAALADLETIRSGFVTNVDWMSTEAVLTEVIGADFASDSTLDALPVHTGSWGNPMHAERKIVPQLGFGVASWRGLKEMNAVILEAMRLPPPQRDPAIDSAEKAYARAFPPDTKLIEMSYVQSARRVDNRDLTLRLLGCALEIDLTHDETGRWDASPECKPYLTETTLSATEQRFSREVEPKQLHFELHGANEGHHE